MRLNARVLALLLAAFGTPVLAGDAGVLVRATELKQKPFFDAPKLADLPERTAVDVIARQGAWMQVKVGSRTGWVKMLNVRMGSTEASVGSNVGGALALGRLFTTGSSGTTVTTGVKGLDEDSLQHAQPNLAELQKMGKFAATAQEAEHFAKAAKLNPSKVEYLTKPDAQGKS
jgi:hypothetical protein